jgi:hypothetical protein
MLERDRPSAFLLLRSGGLQSVCVIVQIAGKPEKAQLTEIREFAFKDSRLLVFALPLKIQKIDGTAFSGLPPQFKFEVSRFHEFFEMDPRRMFLCAKIREEKQANPGDSTAQSQITEWKKAVRFIGIDVTIIVSPYIGGIGRGCFAGNTRLRKVTFEPKSQLRSVEALAFAGVKIAEIALPASVKNIDSTVLDDECRIGMMEANPEPETAARGGVPRARTPQ